jgi:hypothetical protein
MKAEAVEFRATMGVGFPAGIRSVAIHATQTGGRIGHTAAATGWAEAASLAGEGHDPVVPAVTEAKAPRKKNRPPKSRKVRQTVAVTA